MLKIRFTINQTGLALEYFKDGDWRCAVLVRPETVERHGEAGVKSRLLLQMTQRYELVN